MLRPQAVPDADEAPEKLLTPETKQHNGKDVVVNLFASGPAGRMFIVNLLRVKRVHMRCFCYCVRAVN